MNGRVRVSAKAIIIKDGMLLVMKGEDEHGPFYLLPGGGQEPGESLGEALQRECLEEIGTRVEAGEVLFIRDYIGRHHEHAAWDGDVHQLEVMFSCRLPAGAVPRAGDRLDHNQVGLEWLELKRIESYRLYPAELKKRLPSLGREGTGHSTAEPQSEDRGAVYLGDVN